MGHYPWGRGRCWQNFEQIKDMNFRLAFLACVRHVCGVEGCGL